MNRRELYHHGIKGMRWGIRRYQNPDGTLTVEGRKRYGREIISAYGKLDTAKKNLKQEKRNYNRRTLGGLAPTAKAQRDLDYAKLKSRWAKEDVSSAKIKQKISDGKKEKSKHLRNLEEHYRNKGMTKEEAEIAAYKRARTEKILAVTLGLTVAAAGAYVAYKHYDYSVDKVIKSGTIISRISPTDTAAVHDGFYASVGNHDRNKYVGILGRELKKNDKTPFIKTIRTEKNLKIASEKSGLKALQELGTTNQGYKQQLANHLEKEQSYLFTQFGAGDAIAQYQKGINSLKSGKIDKNVYTAMNMSFAGNQNNEFVKSFYSHLASKGYNAVVDVNDKRVSGYFAKMPFIAFNASDVKVERVRKLGESEIRKAYNIGIMDSYVRAIPVALPSMAPSLGVASSMVVGAKVKKSKMNDQIVKKYREQHPNTELTYSEIIRNAERMRYERGR